MLMCRKKQLLFVDLQMGVDDHRLLPFVGRLMCRLIDDVFYSHL